MSREEEEEEEERYGGPPPSLSPPPRRVDLPLSKGQKRRLKRSKKEGIPASEEGRVKRSSHSQEASRGTAVAAASSQEKGQKKGGRKRGVEAGLGEGNEALQRLLDRGWDAVEGREDEGGAPQEAPVVQGDVRLSKAYVEVFGSEAKGIVQVKTEYLYGVGRFHLNPNHLHGLISAVLGTGVNKPMSPFVLSHSSLLRQCVMLSFTELTLSSLGADDWVRMSALFPQCATLMCPGSQNKAYPMAPLMLRTTGPGSSNKDDDKKKKRKKRIGLEQLILTEDELGQNEYPLQVGPDGKPLIDFVSTADCLEDNGLDMAALDCEMVITLPGLMEVARVSLVNGNGATVLDVFVKTQHPITDFCTKWSGITAETVLEYDLETARQMVMRHVTPHTILVGHSLDNDLKCMRLVHRCCADTSVLFPHSQGFPLKRGLRDLAQTFLKLDIQGGHHDSVEDAVVALRLLKLKEENGLSFGLPKKKEDMLSIWDTISTRSGALIIEQSEATALQTTVALGVGAADIIATPSAEQAAISIIAKNRSKGQLVFAAMKFSPQGWFDVVKRVWEGVEPGTLVIVHGGRGDIARLKELEASGALAEEVKQEVLRIRSTPCWFQAK